MTYRVLLVGLGQIGLKLDLGATTSEQVYSHARAFSLHPDFELMAGMDPDNANRALFSNTYALPAYEQLSRALREAEPDVVVVASPTTAHFENVRSILSHSAPQAILCEKPLSYDLSEARAILDLCAEAKCRLYVNYVRRADVAVQHVKGMFSAGDLPLPVKGVVWYSKGLFHNGSHFVDLIRYWLGEPTAFYIIQPGRDWHGDPEPDFLVNIGENAVVFLAAREEAFSNYTAEIVSTHGRLRYDLGGRKVLWQGITPSVSPPGYRFLDQAEQVIPNRLFKIQSEVVNQLAEALRGGQSSLCSGGEAVKLGEHLAALVAARNSVLAAGHA